MADVSGGQKFPDFELPDQQGLPWSLSGQLETGPVMLVFYRGDWCPYCNGQLVSFARKFEEFENRGTQVAGISVDSPAHSSDMVGKLMLPFPLLSDGRGELAKLCSLWNEEEGVAIPAIVVVDRSSEIVYLYEGSDFADRPRDEEIFAALDDLSSETSGYVSDGPAVRLSATEAKEDNVRPDRPPMTLEQLVPYYRGATFATIALKRRFGEWGRAGRDAVREVGRYQTMLHEYSENIRRTRDMHEEAES